MALVAAIALQLTKANYAVYAFALTAAIVLLNSRTGGDVHATDRQRVGFTVIGAMVTAALVAVLEVLLSHARRAARSGSGPGGYAARMTVNEDQTGRGDARPEGDPSQEHPAQQAHGGSMAPGLVDDTGRPVADESDETPTTDSFRG